LLRLLVGLDNPTGKLATEVSAPAKELRMTKIHHKGEITRRRFFERSAGALASAGILAGGLHATEAGPNPRRESDPPTSDPKLKCAKIALEEHFALPGTIPDSYTSLPTPESRLQIQDLGSGRIAEMDRGGLELCILSESGPASIQTILKASEAIEKSRRSNDYLAEHVAKHPKRLKGFAALPMQDPQAAAQELTRCVKDLGFCGALVNGFSQLGEADSAVFYDLPQYRPFWATVQELDVPFYLHPRFPLATRQHAYEGHAWIAGSAWGFAVETSIHALRLMGSGLFDEYPKLKVILGHLGEGLPFGIWRVDHRISRTSVRPKAKLPIAHYLRENFYITTSGAFRTPALIDTISEVGADRVLYSVDYPYEDMGEAAQWFDNAPISEPDRLRIACGNARQLFHL
jgi:2,3-dihydroxybenzoate decarboxylase